MRQRPAAWMASVSAPTHACQSAGIRRLRARPAPAPTWEPGATNHGPTRMSGDADSTRLDGTGSRSAAGQAVPRPPGRRSCRPSGAVRPARGGGRHPAVDEDRRLPRGLRVLPAVGAVRHRARAPAADGRRRDRRRRPQRPGPRRDPLLHGSGVARPQGPPGRARGASGRSGRVARHRDVRDVGDADAGPIRGAGRRRARLLQPQPRHLTRVLRRDHHHPHLPGSPRHAGAMCGPSA